MCIRIICHSVPMLPASIGDSLRKRVTLHRIPVLIYIIPVIRRHNIIVRRTVRYIIDRNDIIFCRAYRLYISRDLILKKQFPIQISKSFISRNLCMAHTPREHKQAQDSQ